MQPVVDYIPRGPVDESSQFLWGLQLTLAKRADNRDQDILHQLAPGFPVVDANDGHHENLLRKLPHQFRLC